MKLGDSRDPHGPGILPLQDFSWVKDGLAQEQKSCVLAVRIKGRLESGSTGFGHWIEDPETRGDVTGWAMLRSWNSTRPPAGWRATPWPARVARKKDAPDTDEHVFAGDVAGEIEPNSRDPSDDPSGDGGGPGKATDGYRPDRPKNVTKDRATRPAVVTTGEKESRNYDYERVFFGHPNSGPYVPGGTVGILVSSTEDWQQRLYFRSTDRRLVASHHGDSDLGTPVHGSTKDGDIDEDNPALLQTIFRVLRKPQGTYGLAGNQHHTVAWNIGLARQGEGVGGFLTDGSGPYTRIAHASVRNGGPFDCGGRKCVHRLGATADGMDIYPLHLSTRTFFRNALGEGLYDAPLEWPSYWPSPDEAPYPVNAYIGLDGKARYAWPRDQPTQRGIGMWRLYSYCHFYPVTPTITHDGDPPPPPEDPGPRTPSDPPPPPEDPGPITPGPDLPGAGTGGGSTSEPPPVGGGGGGGPTTGSGIALPQEPRAPGMAGSHGSATLFPPLLPGVTFRAPWWGTGAPDTARSPRIDHRPHDITQPSVAREEAYGAQRETEGQWRYTEDPAKGTEPGGSAAGGVVFLPPETSLRDAGTDFVRNGITKSTAYRVLVPGTRLAFGLPDLATGAVKKAISIDADANGKVTVRSHDAAGTATDVITIENGIVTLSEGVNLATGATTGSKVGNAADQKVGFHGVAPTAQETGWTAPTGGSGRKQLAVGVDLLTETQDTLASLMTWARTKGFHAT